jgi:hypothetical protein
METASDRSANKRTSFLVLKAELQIIDGVFFKLPKYLLFQECEKCFG